MDKIISDDIDNCLSMTYQYVIENIVQNDKTLNPNGVPLSFDPTVVNSSNIADVLGIDKNAVSALWDYALSVKSHYKNIKPVPMAKEALEELNGLGIKIYLNTARVEAVTRKATIDWLKSNGMIYDNLEFHQPGNKYYNGYVMTKRYNWYVEDNIAEYSSLISSSIFKNTRPTLFLFNTPWSTNFNLHNNFVMVNDWESIVAYIKSHL